MERVQRCPVCGEKAVVPVVYGLPSDALIEAVEWGEAIAAGCEVREGAARLGCTLCGRRYHSLLPLREIPRIDSALKVPDRACRKTQAPPERLWARGAIPLVRGSPRMERDLMAEIERARSLGDRFVVVESLPYFAQFKPNVGAHHYGEVVSNSYLDEEDELSDAQELRLVGLGWLPPGERCHPECPSDHHPNFTKIWSTATSSREITFGFLEALTVVMARRGEMGPPFVVFSVVI